MNSHHQNIRLSLETNQARFLDTIFNVNSDGSVTTKVFENLRNFQPLGTLKYLKDTRGILSVVTFIEPLKLLLIWIHKFYHARYPIRFNKAVIGDSKKKDEN